MATTYWNPNAANYAQVDSLTVGGTPTIGDTVSAVINTKSVTYTIVSGDTTTTVATGLTTLLNNTAVTPPEFQEQSYTSSGAVITVTSGIAGRPFTMTTAATGGHATLTRAAVTANSSASDVNNANNWLRSGVASLPQNGDDVIVADSSVSLLWNLSSLSGVLLNSFTRWMSFTGTIGLPEVNSAGYQEYRSTYLQFSSNVAQLPVILGQGTSGSGPSRERYNVGTVRTNLIVLNSGNAADDYAVRFLGTHVSNTVTVFNTSVGVAILPTEVASMASATCERGRLDLGVGCTISGTVTYDNGRGLVNAAPGTLLLQSSSQVTVEGVTLTFAAVTEKSNSRLVWKSDSNITTLIQQTGAILDKSQDTRAMTITNATVDGDTTQILDPWGAITYTNAVTVSNAVNNGPFTYPAGKTVKIT